MYQADPQVCMNRAVATSPRRATERQGRLSKHAALPGGPLPVTLAGPRLMRPSTIRHQKLAVRPRSHTRRTAGVLLAAGSLGALAVACSDSRNGSRPSARDAVSATAVASGPIPPQNETPDAPRAQALVALKKDVADEKQLAADKTEAAFAATATGAVMPAASAVSSTTSAGAMIIRTGTAGIEVDSLDTAIGRVRTLALHVNGFVANTAVQGGRDQLRSASLELKIPSERFDDALAGLSPIGKVESVNVSAEDVGEEYVDIAARVENAHRLEARIIDLLANRTGKLQDVLSVEHELARVREEIERYEGRMRYLKTRASISTLTIAVHERAPVIVPVAGNGPIFMAFRQAWENFIGLVAGFVASLGVLIPLGALAFVAWLGVKRFIPSRPSGGTPPAAGAVSGD